MVNTRFLAGDDTLSHARWWDAQDEGRGWAGSFWSGVVDKKEGIKDLVDELEAGGARSLSSSDEEDEEDQMTHTKRAGECGVWVCVHG